MPKKERDYHTFGKFAHKVLEDFHLAYIHGSKNSFREEMTIAYRRALEDPEFKEKLTDEMRIESKSIMTKYLKIISEQPFNVVECEAKFEQSIHDDKVEVVLNGMIDRIQIDEDGIYHVADYKTSKSSKYLKEDWFQLLTYAYILLQKHPDITRVRGSYVMLRNDFEYITRDFEKEEILTVVDKYLQYGYKMLTEEQFKPNPTPLCNFCDFQDSCEAGLKKRVNTFNNQGEISW